MGTGADLLMTPLLGFVVGLSVGLTGIGGGAIMTPILILAGGVPPTVAVGTDLVYGAMTKAVGAVVHLRQRTVDLQLAARLAFGSVPGALLGVALIDLIRGASGTAVADRFISRTLGIVLIGVALSLLMRPWLRRAPVADAGDRPRRLRQVPTIVAAATIGLLVGLTSVGSGSLIVATLLILYPDLPPQRIVGTDVFNGLFLTAAAGLAHAHLGTVDWHLLGGLLIGSVPGVWLGSRLVVTLPDRLLRPALAVLLLAVGYKLV
jgi:hypothetical protein